MDIFGTALMDYWHGRATENITTYSSLEETDEIPLSYLFRTYEEMPELEQYALKKCEGKILDLGAGAGSHTLYLQENNHKVTALDISKGAAQVCRLRGIKKVCCEDFKQHTATYNTLLLLMNGTGLAGTLKGLGPFLNQLKKILLPKGQILIEGTDILYMFKSNEADGGVWVPEHTDYYGEVTFTMVYKGQKTTPFLWLYLDYNTLARAAAYHGFSCELIFKGPQDNYLAQLKTL